MAYFYFNSDGILENVAANDSEKNKFSAQATANGWVEKQATDAQLEKAEDSTHLFSLNNDNIVETAITSSYSYDGIKQEKENYLSNIKRYLKNYPNDTQWSTFKTALENFEPAEEVITEGVSNYPITKGFVKYLKDNNITAYSLLRLP